MDTPSAPIDRLESLLSLGEPDPGDGRTYVSELGLSGDDVPGLVELSRGWIDESYLERTGETPALWAPLHAWRALGELGAKVVIPTLLAMLDGLDDQRDEWYLDLFPEVCARIGSSAIFALEAYVLDRTHREYARVAAAQGALAIGGTDREARGRVAEMLARALGRHERGVGALNGFLVSCLIDLEAAEYAGLVERAFRAGVVDEGVVGDWPMVAFELGVGPRPPSRQPLPWGLLASSTLEPAPEPAPAAKARSGGGTKIDKAARKRQKKARRKNRRK